jgi:hypothetical protein
MGQTACKPSLLLTVSRRPLLNFLKTSGFQLRISLIGWQLKSRPGRLLLDQNSRNHEKCHSAMKSIQDRSPASAIRHFSGNWELTPKLRISFGRILFRTELILF